MSRRVSTGSQHPGTIPSVLPAHRPWCVPHATAHPTRIPRPHSRGPRPRPPGTGVGTFPPPLLLFMRRARAKSAAAVSALFILANSAAGLLGNFSSTKRFPSFAIALAVAAVVGGAAGSYLGSRRFDHTIIKRLLAVVLSIAGMKLIFTQ